MEKKSSLLMASFGVRLIKDGVLDLREDKLAIESKRTLWLNERKVRVFSCTAKEEEVMARGHLYSQGYRFSPLLRVCVEGEDIRLKDGGIERVAPEKIQESLPLLAASEVLSCMQEMHRGSTLFFQTGSTHNGILVYDHNIVARVEDISRHCMVDKLIGKAEKAGLDLSQVALFVSCRVTESIMEKVCGAGIPILASTSAVMDRALYLAREYNVSLAGFVRDKRLTLYHGGKIEEKR